MYYKLKTFTDVQRENGRPIQENELDEFYNHAIKKLFSQCSNDGEKTSIRLALSTENLWLKNARPYFNINNDILDSLAHTNLNIDAVYLNDIHNPICINFQEDNELKILTIDNKIYEAKSMLFSFISDNDRFMISLNTFFGDKNVTVNRTFNPIIIIKKSDKLENVLNVVENDFFGNDFFVEKDVCEKIIRMAFGVVLLSKNAYLLPAYDGLCSTVKILTLRDKRRINAAKNQVKKAEISKSSSLQL